MTPRSLYIYIYIYIQFPKQKIVLFIFFDQKGKDDIIKKKFLFVMKDIMV